MADFLIQRYSTTTVPPGSMGVWIDEGSVTPADTQAATVQAAVEAFVVGRGIELTAIRRVTRWDTAVEFTMQPSAVQAVSEPKQLRV